MRFSAVVTKEGAEQRVIDIKKLQTLLIFWYKKHGRPFFWRTRDLSPWDWLFIEFCLQRTRAETVNKYTPLLLNKYTNPEAVIITSIEDIENDFKKLGYYKIRARKIKTICNYLVSNYDSKVPNNYENLISIPHVGDYISKAVLCFAFKQRYNLIDSNIARILTRIMALDKPYSLFSFELYQTSQLLLPSKQIAEYHYALIDLASLFCIKNPRCSLCPLSKNCLSTINVKLSK